MKFSSQITYCPTESQIGKTNQVLSDKLLSFGIEMGRALQRIEIKSTDCFLFFLKKKTIIFLKQNI